MKLCICIHKISIKRYHNQHAIQESDTDQWSNSLNLMAGQSAGELKTPVEHGGSGGLEDTQCGSIWVHVCVLAGLKLTKMDQH